MDIINELERFIVDEIMLDSHLEGVTIEPEQDLMFDKSIDSLGILKLIAFMEKNFGIKIFDEEIVPENFRTIKSMKNFIELKQHRS